MTADFVENLMKLLSAQGARGLRLASGSPAQMVDAAGSSRNVSTRTLTRQEILGAITPIVPEHARADLPQAPSVEFEYSVAAVGDFKVRIVRDGEQLAVSIVRNGANGSIDLPEPAKAAPPPPVAPPAEPASPPAPTPAVPPAPTPIPVARIPVSQAVSAPTPPAPAAPPPQPAPQAAAAAPPAAPSQPAPAPPPAPPAAASGPVAGAPAIDRLFFAMCGMKASDLHISSGMPPLVRKDGEICSLEEGAAPLSGNDVVALLEPIMPEKNRAEFERRHDTDFAYEIPGLARFRANVFMDRKGRGAVFRVIPSKILTAEDLGLSPHILQLCRLNKGLVLVTGPTGSGKSTTLCGMIDYINRNRSDHIITIEDPIEFVHENKTCLMNQREVHTHTDSFKDALRAALREDPDIILVGEMRDLETVAIAIETAETGHLVFGTLHTTTAASTVDRVIDQFPTDRQAQIRIMLSESLKGVIAQTLCKKIGGGRVAALEVLIVTSAISNLIREAKTFQIPSLMQVGKAIGMVTLNDALFDLVTRKLVEPQEAYLKSVDKTGFEGLLKRAGLDTKFIQGTPSH
jgi:twitching motility protein PilT